MDYQKELNYLNNLEAQFRIIGQVLLDAKKREEKTINLKKLCQQNKSGIKCEEKNK